MATPETNLAASRGPPDVNGNHASHPSSARHLHNFNTFQFVSQLVSATPPYLFNMSAPFPGNFFSDLLRRMAPRAGTAGMPPDANLQQHIRAALLAKGAPPPTLPQSVMPPPLDLAALAAQHRHQQSLPPSSSQDKGIKRSLFADVSALSACEDENGIKRPRLDDSRDERREHPPEGLTAPFLMQPPFLPSAVHHPNDVISPWSARASLMRPQIPIPSHVPPAPLDPYRLLLDLRLAGQLRSMAANQVLLHKEPPLGHSPLVSPLSNTSRISPPREARPIKEEAPTSTALTQPTTLRGDDSRVSAFHPPGRPNDAPPDTSDEESCERRSHSRNSNNSNSSSSSNKDGLGPQYIFKHLTEIYRTIDIQRNDNGESNIDEPRGSYSLPGEVVRPASDLARPSAGDAHNNSTDSTRSIEGDKSNNNGGDCHNKTSIFNEESPRDRDYYSSVNGHIEGRRSPPQDGSKLDVDHDKDGRRLD